MKNSFRVIIALTFLMQSHFGLAQSASIRHAADPVTDRAVRSNTSHFATMPSVTESKPVVVQPARDAVHISDQPPSLPQGPPDDPIGVDY